MARATPDDHETAKNCKCETYRIDRLNGCALPYGCKATASRLLNKLPPKWNPQFSEIHHSGDLENDDLTEGKAIENGSISTFNPDMTVRGGLTQGFRVFAEVGKEPHLPAVCNGPPRGE